MSYLASKNFGDELHEATAALGEMVPGDTLKAAEAADANHDGLLDTNEFHRLVMSATSRPCGATLFLVRRAFHEAVLAAPFVLGFLCALLAILGGPHALPAVFQAQWAAVAAAFGALSFGRLSLVHQAHGMAVVRLGIDRIVWLLAVAAVLLAYGQYRPGPPGAVS